MSYKEKYLHIIERLKEKPYEIRHFVRFVLQNERIPELEEAIVNIPQCSVEYAVFTIKGRWIEAEEAIRQTYHAAQYSMCIMHERWPEAEDTIKKDGTYWPTYISFFSLNSSREVQTSWLKDPRFNIEYTLEILNQVGSTLEQQELIVQQRPDLISKIKNLRKTIQKKYQHELNLTTTEI